jgi:hypothetical protein
VRGRTATLKWTTKQKQVLAARRPGKGSGAQVAMGTNEPGHRRVALHHMLLCSSLRQHPSSIHQLSFILSIGAVRWAGDSFSSAHCARRQTAEFGTPVEIAGSGDSHLFRLLRCQSIIIVIN